MPAWLLLLKIRNFLIPLPWFLLWIILFPFAIVASLVGGVLRFLGVRWYPVRVMSVSLRALKLITCLHGLEVNVSASSENVLVRFI